MFLGHMFTRDAAPSASKRPTPIFAAGSSEMGPLPSSLDAERAVLGAILLNETVLTAVIEAGLSCEHFSVDLHFRIFSHMLALRDRCHPVDLVMLVDSLKIEGEDAAYVASLADGMPKVSNVEHYVRIVKEKAVLRELIQTTENIQQHAFASADSAEVIVRNGIETLSTIATNAGSAMNWRDRFHTPAELSDSEADFLIDGILPPGVTFIGARSGTGKTWFALSMARALSTGNKFLGQFSVTESIGCLYLCPEVSAQSFKRRLRRFDITERFFCQTIQDGPPLDLQDSALVAAIRKLKPVIFLDTAIRFAGAKDENSSAENAAGLGRAIFRLIHLGARAVVRLHHRAKETVRVEEMTLENVLRGTGDLGAVADSVWGLQYDRESRGAEYLRESQSLVRLHVKCVKSRDSKPIPDFRVQLFPFLDQSRDFGILNDKSTLLHGTEAEHLTMAIEEDQKRTKLDLERITGIGRNRIERIASEAGWLYQKGVGWRRLR
jgi:hypothetical protein